LFAGLFALALAGVVFAGLLVLLAGVVLTGVVLTGAGVAAGVFAGVVLAGLFVLALFAGASPQAIPKAAKPRTVESAITFFILIKTPNHSQGIKYLIPGVGRSDTAVCPKLFLI
jgi:hypothetical protein